MADKYITKKRARLYDGLGRETRYYVPVDTVLECNAAWFTGQLFGLQRIMTGDYTGKFVKAVDIKKVEPKPEPKYDVKILEVRGTVKEEGKAEEPFTWQPPK